MDNSGVALSHWVKVDKTEAGVKLEAKRTDGGNALVSIEFIQESVLRYKIASSENNCGNELIGVTPKSGLKVVTSLGKREDGKPYIVLKSDKIRAIVDQDPWAIQIETVNGHSVTKEKPVDNDVRGLRQSQPTGFDMRDGRIITSRSTWHMGSQEHFYGMGEKFTDLDKRGRNITCWNRNAFGAGREFAHKNVPFFISSLGYGMFLNTTVRSHYKFGTESNFAYSIEVEDDNADLFFIYGPSFKHIIKTFHSLTGVPAVPPKWSFGLWVSVLGDKRDGEDVSQTSILKVADEIRERGIPADVIHLDPFWMGKNGYCDFQWGKDYPEPDVMINMLKNKGFHFSLWEHPYVDMRTNMYAEGSAQGFFLKRADGSTYNEHLVIAAEDEREYIEDYYDLGGVVDFSNPQAVAWYKDKHRPLVEMGVDVFKTDFGEDIPEDAIFFNGKTGREMRNVYSVLYNKCVFELLGEYFERPMVWGRSGYAGSQKYPVDWSGDPLCDFPSMASTLRGGLSYGLSGVPFWTHDLGGFKGRPSDELYIRWIQFGLFSALSRLHGTTTRLPWRFCEKVQQIFKKYIELRYSLLPYIYSVAMEAGETGLPFIRAMVLEFQDDPQTYNLDSQYMFGPSLLVAPVLNEQGEVCVYLPEGEWYDFYNGTRHVGPRIIKEVVPLEVLPVYVRQDSILPSTKVTQYITEEPWDSLILDVFLKSRAEIILREDHGNATYAAERRSDSILIYLPSRPVYTDYRIRLRDVECVDTAVAQGSLQKELVWRHDKESQILHLELGVPLGKSAKIKICL